MADDKGFLPPQIQNFLSRFTPSQKIFIGSVIVLTIAGIFLISNLVNTFTYGVLFSNLSTKDSGLIIEQLKAKKVPYQISGGGSVIKIPESQVPELRIELAASGIPEGSGVGFEIFDKTNLSTTDFIQNINYVRATEGELARTITQLREVISAKVHITMPKRSVFIEDQEPAKASVILKLKPGARIASNIIPAILHLTAQSVEGLKPDNIAIVDLYGTLLSKPSGGDADTFDDTQLAFQKKMEKSYTKEILDMLEPVVGHGKVRARVKLELDFNKIESTEEIVDPDKVAKVSEKTESQSSTGAAVAGGVPGVASNVGQSTGPGGGRTTTTTPSKSKGEKSTTNFEVSKKVTHVIRPVGEVKKISAAVVVDDLLQVQIVDDKMQEETRKRTPEELASYKLLVQAAIGFNNTRGDLVEVVNLSFDTAVATQSQHLEKERLDDEKFDNYIKYGTYGVAFLLLFLFIIRPIFNKMASIMKNLGTAKQEEIEIPRVDSDRMAALQSAKDDAEIEKELMEQYKIPKSSKKMGIIKSKVIEFAEENVDGTASLVKSFLMEE
ncbi:MAG: flagellar M-ring protein FliF [bacterium]|nr:flagellar M-ring protein FliF [bacterium]